MENLSNLHRYDWFHSIEGNVVYVNYMNSKIFNLIPQEMKIYFAAFKTFDASKYFQIIEE